VVTRKLGTLTTSLALALALLAGCGASPPHATGGATATATAPTGTQPAPPEQDGLPVVAYSKDSPPPAWPGPLPYPIIIADRANDRILEVTPDKRIVWQFPGPNGIQPPGAKFGDDDDVFFTPGGKTVITNEEHQGTIAEVDYYTRQVIWTYGHYGVQRYGDGYLNYPDDAYRLPDGTTIVADIRNCRELFISPDKRIIQQWGLEQAGGSGACPRSAPPTYLGSPNGDTPQPNGDVLLSLINGNLVALMSHDGKLIWQAHVPDLGNGYVSDAQLLPDGDVLTAGYGKPGRIVIFNPHTGQVDWLYDVASGPGALDHPSLAEQLPNGNIIANDDYNHRVVVIDRQSKQIVWQYGVTGVPGSAPGYLNTPDGLDLDVYRDWRTWLAAHPGFGVAGIPSGQPGPVRPNPEQGENGGGT
jgi:outer membrane protein assembly factor BamB